MVCRNFWRINFKYLFIMTVETLIEFLQTLPKDTKVITFDNDRNYTCREVDFKFTQTINKDGKIEKTLEVK